MHHWSRWKCRRANPTPRFQCPDDPQWSPDGKSLIAALYPPGIGGKLEDFSAVQYDFQKKKFTTIPGSEQTVGPRWSPDGRYISFFTADTKKEKLLEVSTGKWSDLAKGTVLNYPNWSPDSKYAYFEVIGTDGPEIDRVSIATHKKERVVSLKGIARVNMPDSNAPWNGVAPDGPPDHARRREPRNLLPGAAIAVARESLLTSGQHARRSCDHKKALQIRGLFGN